MSKSKRLVWAAFYAYTIMLAVGDCYKALSRHSIEAFGASFDPGFAIAGLMAGTVLSVLWPIGISFAIFTVIDHIEIWWSHRIKQKPDRWFSLFSESPQ